jgi:protein phosphatase
MGSRAVAVVCRDPAVAVSRFGLRQERRGVIYTRTGRPFFSDAATEAALLDRLAAALARNPKLNDFELSGARFCR